jgi:hypothetical protein
MHACPAIPCRSHNNAFAKATYKNIRDPQSSNLQKKNTAANRVYAPHREGHKLC